MTDKEFKRLSRTELIELLYELQKQNNEKSVQIEKLEKQLNEKALHISKAGNIAEAALKLSGVFETAQAAADRYLVSIRELDSECIQRKQEAEEQRQNIICEANEKAEKMIANAKEQAQKISDTVEQQVAEKWNRFEQQANTLISAHAELQALMGRSNNK